MWKQLLKQRGLRQIPEIGEGATFLRKWGFIGILIGIGAGLGALLLSWFIGVVTHFVLSTIVGYTPPLPGGEGGTEHYAFHMERWWLLPVVTAGAGLVGGLLTWKFAPTTAGIGTNAAIRAFHNNEKVKFHISIFKLITSGITIGGGLTSGREGPIAQIGAATGASIADALKLTARERNIALAAGLGAGIAAIFKAPLAGAIISAEIFYKEDFEVEALVPGLIASVVGYTIVGAVTGFQPVFNPPPQITQFDHPFSLILLFALLGVGCALFRPGFYLRRLFSNPGVFQTISFVPGHDDRRTLHRYHRPRHSSCHRNRLRLGRNLSPSHNKPTCSRPGCSSSPRLPKSPLRVVGRSGSGNSGGIFSPRASSPAECSAAHSGPRSRIFSQLTVPHPGTYAIVGTSIAFFAASAKAPFPPSS